MYSIYSINAQIRSIDVKISQCNAAKVALQGVKNTCQGQVTSLNGSYNKISGNSDLSTVKKDDVFEGEMANSLAAKVSDLLADLSSAKTKAEGIVTAIDSQILSIDNRISSLNVERSNWCIHLANVQNQP